MGGLGAHILDHLVVRGVVLVRLLVENDIFDGVPEVSMMLASSIFGRLLLSFVLSLINVYLVPCLVMGLLG